MGYTPQLLPKNVATANRSPATSDKCATVDLAPFSAGSELNSLGLGVASTFGGLSSSAGSFYTFSERVNITLWCTASGDEKGLSIQFNGYGPEDALPKKPEAE